MKGISGDGLIVWAATLILLLVLAIETPNLPVIQDFTANSHELLRALFVSLAGVTTIKALFGE